MMEKTESNNTKFEGNSGIVISLKNITKRFDSNVVLDDISLEIEKAEKRKFISLRKLSEPEFKVSDEKIGKKTTEKKKITDKPIKDESQK